MKMNKQTLSIIMAAEATLIVCVCIGIGGVFFYNGGLGGGSADSDIQPGDTAATVAPLDAPTTASVGETPIAESTAAPKGTTLENLPDGTSKFSDLDGSYEIVLPVGWLGTRPNYPDEFNAILASKGAQNEMLRDQMNMDMSGYQPEFDRLFSYPLRPDIMKDVAFGFSKLSWNPNDPKPIDNDTLRELVDELKTSGAIPNLRLTVSTIIENGNGVSIIVIKGRFSLEDGQGGSNPFAATILFFKPNPASTIRMTFTVVQDYEEQISQDIDAIVESIKLFEQ